MFICIVGLTHPETLLENRAVSQFLLRDQKLPKTVRAMLGRRCPLAGTGCI